MNLMSMDLEMNQPSRSIIQIGAVVGNLKTGAIVGTFSRIVNPHEIISQSIIELTGITQEQADNGTTLYGAYKELVLFKEKHKAHKQLIGWGDGDTHLLRKQLALTKDSEDWKFGHRFYDTKTLFQSIRLAKGQGQKAGLAKALASHSMEFKGLEHRAQDDALNTFLLFHKIIKQLGDLKC